MKTKVVVKSRFKPSEKSLLYALKIDVNTINSHCNRPRYGYLSTVGLCPSLVHFLLRRRWPL